MHKEDKYPKESSTNFVFFVLSLCAFVVKNIAQSVKHKAHKEDKVHIGSSSSVKHKVHKEDKYPKESSTNFVFFVLSLCAFVVKNITHSVKHNAHKEDKVHIGSSRSVKHKEDKEDKYPKESSTNFVFFVLSLCAFVVKNIAQSVKHKVHKEDKVHIGSSHSVKHKETKRTKTQKNQALTLCSLRFHFVPLW